MNIAAKIAILYCQQSDLHSGEAASKLKSEANRFLEIALKIDPDSIEGLSCLAILTVKKGNLEEARKIFEKLAEIRPDEAKWKLMVASCLRRMEKFADALEVYERILVDFPENLECRWKYKGFFRFSVHFGNSGKIGASFGAV